MQWEVNDCGEQTGDPALDRGRDIPADGKRSMWGSYGTLSACIHSSTEPRQAWVAFLNSDVRVQETWCTQRNRTPIQSSASLRAFVEDINGLLTRPCV